ncbi:MAG: DUF6502 family protein, partial [Gammaproteobacteria bacterium]|nr:DUF6502 family protein [Gammaproteobacteria bacterium]
MRLLIHYKISFPYVNQMIKALYLDVATRDFNPVDGRQTDSRLNLLTGVHRKDIRRFREDQSLFLNEDRKGVSLAAQVVATWMSVPPYCDDHGLPNTLFRLRSSGEPNFEDLVDLISR